MLLVAYSASAQEDVPVPVPGPSANTIYNQETADDEKPLLLEESRSMKLPDSLQFHRAITPAAKPKDPKKQQAEGDPLNFNFLYYIIQKFKASEVME